VTTFTTEDRKAAMQLYRFSDKVCATPEYAPYKGHKFRIDHYHHEDELNEHVWVICIDDDAIIVQGYVHVSDLEVIDELEDYRKQAMGLWFEGGSCTGGKPE
jgi:hypothetical protein